MQWIVLQIITPQPIYFTQPRPNAFSMKLVVVVININTNIRSDHKIDLSNLLIINNK